VSEGRSPRPSAYQARGQHPLGCLYTSEPPSLTLSSWPYAWGTDSARLEAVVLAPALRTQEGRGL
jgi:hypothetical protein